MNILMLKNIAIEQVVSIAVKSVTSFAITYALFGSVKIAFGLWFIYTANSFALGFLVRYCFARWVK